jgi:hypothetical protein
MTVRQKRILAVLAVVDAIVVAGLILAMTNYARESTGWRKNDSGREYTAWDCQWWATQRLAQAGLAGRVTVVGDGALRFEITYPERLESSRRSTAVLASQPAQAVWTAFDIALGAVNECPTFTRVEVTIVAPEPQIHASVRTLDLVAMRNGELSENEFIERVTYEVMGDP